LSYVSLTRVGYRSRRSHDYRRRLFGREIHHAPALSGSHSDDGSEDWDVFLCRRQYHRRPNPAASSTSNVRMIRP